MKFSGKMFLKTILKVTKNQGFTHSLEDTFFRKTTRGVKLTRPVNKLFPIENTYQEPTKRVWQGNKS